MDVHVHRAITAALRLRGVDVLTAQEDSCAELDDAALLDRRLYLAFCLLKTETFSAKRRIGNKRVKASAVLSTRIRLE